MFCSTCGKEQSDDAKFCMNCGNPMMKASGSEIDWEYCDIVYDLKKGFHFAFKFWAKAINPRGIVYNAGEMPAKVPLISQGPFYPRSDWTSVIEAHTKLISLLINEGWKDTGQRGQDWYAYRFKRAVQNS